MKISSGRYGIYRCNLCFQDRKHIRSNLFALFLCRQYTQRRCSPIHLGDLSCLYLHPLHKLPPINSVQIAKTERRNDNLLCTFIIHFFDNMIVFINYYSQSASEFCLFIVIRPIKIIDIFFASYNYTL